MLDAGDKSMVLWFGLKERLEKVEEILVNTGDAISKLSEEMSKLNENMSKLSRKVEEIGELSTGEGENDFETGSKTRKSVADRLLQETERLKMATAMKRIQAIEKALGLAPVAKAVEETTGLEPDVIKNIMEFVKQNPEIIETIKNIFSSNKTPQQQKQEVENVLEQYLRPIPLKQSQGQTQQ